ncbi:MAG: hypothetical protein IJD33_04685 [Clostridia bacterium]|nr:hypothetical protein [Clostridia bacterium]
MENKQQTEKTENKVEGQEVKKTAPVETNKTKNDGQKSSQKANKPAVKPAEKPAAKPAEKPVEKTTEKPVEKVEEKKVEEKKEPTFIADPKDRRPRGYAARVQIAARYTDEQAQNMLRKKIYQYKEVHLRFLRKVEEPNAFKIEKMYVPVYCAKSDVRYSWKTKVNKVESAHEEICTREKRFTGANKDLDATNFLLDKLPEVMEKKKSELIESDEYNFKKTVHKFNACIKTSAPAKHANIEKRGEEYTLVYVPIMKTTCTLDGEKYVGYVNLHNGACYSSYKVTDTVSKAAEKSVLGGRLAKRTLWGTFLFTLTLCLLTFFSALKLADWKFGDLTTETIWVSCVLFALALPSFALALGINAVKKEALIEKAVRLNKLPGVAWARFVSVVGVICTIGAVLLFFFQVMI